MASKLPIEVVTHIMSFLGVPDRKEAALVCQAWYEASLDPALQQNIIVNFSYEKTGEILQSFQRRRLSHLVLSQFDNSSSSTNAILKSFEQISEDLKSLSLKDSNITEGTLLQMLLKCPHLESLDLSGCNSLFMAGTLLNNNEKAQQLEKAMKNVKELKLASLRYISDNSFHRLMAAFPNLSKLSLASSQITYNGSAYYSRTSAVYDNTAVFTFFKLEQYISDHVRQLKVLDLSRTSITNEHLGQLVRITDLQLEELFLVGCRDIGNEGVNRLCQHQTSLRVLDLTECVDVRDVGVANITTHLSKLETLRLNKCHMITNASIGLLKNLPHLQVLDLVECYELTSAGLVTGLCEVVKSSLTHLNLSCCSKVDTDLVIKLAQHVPILQHLDLSSCFLLQDVGLHNISSSLHNLRTLRLAWCKSITNLGLLGLQANGLCPVHDPVDSQLNGECSCSGKSKFPVIFRKPTEALREKNEATVKRMIAELNDAFVPQSLSALTYLQNLDLSSCPQLTDLGLRGAIKFCELRVLKMNLLHGLTDEGLTDIAINNPGLEELQLQQCARISDTGIDIVTQRCQRLIYLDVSNCDRLTDTSLLHIQDNCRRLRHLDLSYCSSLTIQAVDQLEARMQTLTSLRRLNIADSSK
ncbi:F-box/LRR-repeat protein 20-like isoform X2 [Pomacea canaliculata]|uniref:F-box/LRR-repeat protein 20-like isoform X2 n=1 Tax=Pomacea canaliculata TaxID=400727 RepID=UPI000D72C582|nr:F-box/LRR-repeat protein 20-like isoform X2 [Pomacea canaliculata]